MEINSDFNIFGQPNKKENNKIYPNLAPLKQDTVSFSGKIFSFGEKNNILFNRKFEELKNQAEEKINALPDEIKQRYEGMQLTKNNIGLACKILQSDELYKNEDFMSGFFYPIVYKGSYSKDAAKNMETVADALLNSGFKYDNDTLSYYFYELIYNSETPEKAQCASRLINTMSRSPLAGDKDFIEKAVYNIGTPDTYAKFNFPQKAEAACMIFDTFGSQEFLNNKSFFKHGVNLLAYDFINQLNNPEKVKGGCILLDKITNSPFAESEDFTKKIPDLLEGADTEETAQAKCILFDKAVETGLYNYKNFMNISCISDTESKEQAQAICKVIDKLKDMSLIDDEEFMSNFEDIFHYCRNEEEAEAKCILLDKFAETGLIGSEEFMDNFKGILRTSRSTEGANAACILLDKLIETELIDKKEFMKDFKTVLQCPRSTEGANAACILLDKLIETGLIDKKEFNDDSIFFVRSDKEAQIRCKMIDKLKKEGFLCSEDFLNTASIISCTDSEERMEANGILLDKMKDKGLINNKNFINAAPALFSQIRTPEEVRVRCMFLDKLIDTGLIDNEDFMNNGAVRAINGIKTKEDAEKKCKLIDEVTSGKYKDKIPPKQIVFLLRYQDKITPEELYKLDTVMGKDNVDKLSYIGDISLALEFIDIYKREDINELTRSGKKALLRRLISYNTDLFRFSEDMKESFPLLPENKEEYCTLLPSIVRSLGIETNTLNNYEIQEFNENLSNLGNALSKLSDEEFGNLKITQEYDKDKFITDTLKTLKDLEPNEKQKVYDYFGFELHQNGKSETGYSITGYPVNLNNGKKLAQITDPKTRETIEKLRPLVIEFSQDNKIECTNKELEPLLNDIADVLPELRPQIGKFQHGVHEFDVFKHSLKVMQKTVQNPEFNNLNETDKKIMLIASLLHDITKREGYADKTHASEGSFDSFFISKKFNLTQEEEIKLYTLIKTHEWLGKVNTSKDEKELEKNLKSTAYDLRDDNMLDMSLIFTHADLKAVKSNDGFHDTRDGSSRVDFNGKIRSFGESADYYAEKMKGYTEELKKTQPVLPVTKIPSSDRIDEAVTAVYPDGSTNIKGIYKDKDGLIVIKYNEVEDWEAIGFPQGSISRGIKTVTQTGKEVDTGNIKFFVHGLDSSDRAINFDAFSLPDSDALLSVSYAERPESKYRFFRPQGLVLDTDTTYIHGGGKTDSGSGYKKTVDTFKNNYIFGGYREDDRTYISNLIKNETGMTDDEYVEFVNENRNKSFTEIEPEELREKIIKAFASINSNVRRGERSYNEMYISNPKPPMAVFAYNTDDYKTTGNPIEFLASETKRTEFPRRYALEHNIPFIVFGD